MEDQSATRSRSLSSDEGSHTVKTEGHHRETHLLTRKQSRQNSDAGPTTHSGSFNVFGNPRRSRSADETGSTTKRHQLKDPSQGQDHDEVEGKHKPMSAVKGGKDFPKVTKIPIKILELKDRRISKSPQTVIHAGSDVGELSKLDPLTFPSWKHQPNLTAKKSNQTRVRGIQSLQDDKPQEMTRGQKNHKDLRGSGISEDDSSGAANGRSSSEQRPATKRETKTTLSKARRKLFNGSTVSNQDDIPVTPHVTPDGSPPSEREAGEGGAYGSSAESLKSLNVDLRLQVTKLRYQLEAQRGSIKHALWQKVLDIRNVRQKEQQRLLDELSDQRGKLDREKSREMEALRDQLTAKAESDAQKLARHKDAEISKLKFELSSKESMLQRLLGENRHARLKLNIDDRKSRLVDELKDLRRQKKELEESLDSASSAERKFSNHLRRHSQTFDQELIRIKREAHVKIKHLIEQLKNKDKLISQLEKDLGHQWVAAQLAALERESSEGARAPAIHAPSHSLGALPEDSVDPTVFTWTPTSTPTTGGVEDGWSTEGYTQGKQDLPIKLKDMKERNKELVEKCRAYLQRTKELTAQNRAYKDSSETVLHENKKMQELLEHSKLRVLQLTRQLNEQKEEKNNMEQQGSQVEELKKIIMEDRKTINALKQSCSEKDRRIELIQHRKKRRRLMTPPEKNIGIKETFFGYDEDNKSMDSDVSISSVSHSTISDDDAWDEVMSREETERNYQRLMMEQLQLQKSHALLQKQTDNIQDPQREAMSKMALQNDLYNAQCRIEKLEQLINEIGEGEVMMLLKERETMLANNREATEKASFWESQSRRLQHELNKAMERSEDLEFQLMELENTEAEDDSLSSSCEGSIHGVEILDHELIESLAGIALGLQGTQQEMEQLRKDVALLVKGREGDALLKKFDKVKEDNKKHADSLESMAHELQMKVITLQKEKDSLHDQLSHKGQKPGKADQSSSFTSSNAAAREKQENLELKAELSKLINSENKLLEDRIHLHDELEDWKTQYEYLKQQLDILTRTQQGQQPSLKNDNSSSPNNDSSSSPTSTLVRTPSKDRKSKSRSGDDPTQTKRRKSSQDASPDMQPNNLLSFKSVGDIKSEQGQITARHFNSLENMQTTGSLDDIAEVKHKLKALEFELVEYKEENYNLKDQLLQSALEKSSEAEADQQILLNKVEMLKSETELLKRENVALSQKLQQRIEEFHDGQDELNPRVTELEDYCEDLQERLYAAEVAERQMREKLKLVEGSIDEAENNEMAIRKKYEQLLAREAEAKKQIRELQRTGHELKDIVLDKDFMEQALREKVDFLQKCEAASVKRIEELEAIEQDLREQLASKSDPRCQRELNKIQELKHQITFLETDNKALSARVAELEENEETLRENWRRVADEDFNRTQSLEEKVKMLEVMNRELKAKLADAQEYFVINSVSPSENSLAAELAQSQSKVHHDVPPAGSGVDSVDGLSRGDSIEKLKSDPEKKNLVEKLIKLERQLSDVSEKKNSKIEALQEKIVSQKETEIKLSETISEMEMTERELRAKLALYESSEVTVEKMLKYQSKIEELRTSQESLLDQLESMENQEMTLQEKMQEMERTLRGKIVTLEVEMKGFKQKELKNAARIRELEKQEKDLSERVAQQAEKENSLYVKISALMDELKKAKEEVENLNYQLTGKEDKVRKAKLLEVRLLEIEMEYAKKVSDISSKLRHKEEELRLKEASHEEDLNNLQNEIATLQSELNTRESEKNRRISILEKMFAQKEKDLMSKIDVLQENMKELTHEKSMYVAQLRLLEEKNNDLEGKDIGYAKEMDILREEVTSIKTSEKEYEEKIAALEENLQKEKKRADASDKKIDLLEKELAKEKENVLSIEGKIKGLKGDVGEKMKTIESSFIEKESEYEKELQTLLDELDVKNERVKELETELEGKVKRVDELEAECMKLRSKAATGDQDARGKIEQLEKLLSEKKLKLEEFERNVTVREEEMSRLKEQGAQVDELKRKVVFLNTQLLQEVAAREQIEADIAKSSDKDQTLSLQINQLKKESEQQKQNLLEKLKELEAKNKEICEVNLELSNLRYSNKTLQNEFENLREKLHDTENTFRKQISDKVLALQQAEAEIKHLKSEISERDRVVQDATEKEKLLQKQHTELLQQAQEKAQKDVIVKEHMQKSEHMLQLKVQEQENKESELKKLRKDLAEKVHLLDKCATEKHEMEAEMHNLISQKNDLDQQVAELTQMLENQHSEAQVYQKDLFNAKKEKETSLSEVLLLRKQVEEKHSEVEKQTSERSNTQSLISAKQQELELARTELKKCLEEIDQYKKISTQEKQQVNERDQAYRKMSAELEELTLQFEERDQDCKHLKFKVADVELKLVQAENRYRELEAKCASLEMQLEKRFAQAQEAEKVIKLKVEECQKLEAKLVNMEKEYQSTSAQMHEAERIIMNKDKEFRAMKSKLETVSKEYELIQFSMKQKDLECQDVKSHLASLEKEHQHLKAESASLQQAYDEVQSGQHGSQLEVNQLREQVLLQQKKLEDTNSKLKVSDDYLLEADSSFRSLELKCQDTHTQLVLREQQIQTLEKNLLETEKEMESLKSKLIDNERMLSETKSNLKKAENNFKEKCGHFEIMKSTAEKSDLHLKSCEDRCDKLKEKLSTAESHLLESSHRISELTNKISIVENALKEKESFCRDSQSGFDSLEQQHLETKIECENLKSKLSYFQQMLSHSQATCAEHEEKVKELESALGQSQNMQVHSQEKLSEKEAAYNQLVSHVDLLQKSSQEAKMSEEKLKGLSSEKEKLAAALQKYEQKCSDLESECRKIQEEKDAKTLAVKSLEASRLELSGTLQMLEQENLKLTEKLKEAAQQYNSSEDNISELVQTNQNLSGKLYKLKGAHKETQKTMGLLEEKIIQLTKERDDAFGQTGNLQHAIRQLEEDNNKIKNSLRDIRQQSENMSANVEDSRSRADELLKHNEQLQKQCETLQNEKNKLLMSFEQQDMLAKQEQESLVMQVEQYKKELKELMNSLGLIKSEGALQLENFTKLNSEYASILNKFSVSEGANRELEQSLRFAQLELSEMNKIKSVSDARLVDAESKLVKMTEKLAAGEELTQKLQSENKYLKGRVVELEKDCSDLHQKCETNAGSDIVSEEQITVSVRPGLHMLPSQGRSNEELLATKLSSLESHHDETVGKMEQLLRQIESYKTSDASNQEKLRSLEKTLKSLRERDKKMSDRVNELEEKERQLLEQIADIEATVIVPLETENQELKDEISVLRQERDDAQANASKWGDEDVEGVHKSLEDALLQREELERKVTFLSEEITKLELERESFMKQISELKGAEGEFMDKVELLEDEVERLRNLEQQKSVVEEAETRLMDRVLDLEEREQMLLAEISQLKKRNMKSAGVQTDENMNSYREMIEKCVYLEQKNAVLQDAEGRYTDKIMELEELQERLQSQINILRTSAVDQTGNPSASIDNYASSFTSSSQHSLSFANNEETGAKYKSVVSISTDTFDLFLPSEQTLSPDQMSFYLSQLENQNQSLVNQNEEKTKKLQYLESKLELLHDSEAKLMENLVGNLEGTAGASNSDSELQSKIDHLVEENEFLAQNVENYKQLYKEAKQKCNELQDRFMEDGSVLHDLHEAQSELKATQNMVEEIQSEYEDQLSEKEQQLAQLDSLLNQSRQREDDLQTQLVVLKQHGDTLQRRLDLAQQGLPQTSSTEEELQKYVNELKALHEQKEQEFRQQFETFHQREVDFQNQHQQQVDRLEDHVKDLRRHEHDLLLQVETLKEREKELKEAISAVRENEVLALKKVDSLNKQVQELKLHDRREEDSVQSDSGLSADDPRGRYDQFEKDLGNKSSSPEPIQEVYSSRVTLNLARPTSGSPSHGTTPAGSHAGIPTPPPVAPPRRYKARQSSVDSTGQEELIFLVEELQSKEISLKRRIHELEALAETDLSQRVEELESINQSLERRLRYAEGQLSLEGSSSPGGGQSKSSYLYLGGDSNNNNPGRENNESRDLDNSFSSVVSRSSSQTMLDKPEDVLQQRIKDLENLDKHNKNQLSDLEHDREVLHEIARKDKATIHDLQVKIRELQLSERSLKEQVNSLEISEGSLYTKCEDLEATRLRLEDRVHELEIHERRLRELVRRLKLDEEHWLSKSGGMETAVAELAAHEHQLKRLLQDTEMQKGGLSERISYLEARINELENVEITLLQRLKSYEINEANLKNRLGHIENSEAAALSKAYELDMVNIDLSQRLQKAVEECAILSQHISQLQGQIQELDRQLLSSKDSELAYKQHVDSLQKNESSLQKKVREYELREIDSQARVRELEQTNEILNDKTAALQRSENKLKFRVQELEGLGDQNPGELSQAQRQKLPQKLEDCHKFIVVLQKQIENLQLQLKNALTVTQAQLVSEHQGGNVSISVDEYSQLHTKSALLEETIYQMEEVERLNTQLNETILQLRKGKGASGHEVEIEVLKRRLSSYKTFISKLKSSLSTGQATSLLESEQDSDPPGETLPARHVHGLESERVLQSVRGHQQEGKADTISTKGAQQVGQAPEEKTQVQSKAKAPALSAEKTEPTSSREESHWRAIEARKPMAVAGSRGGALATFGVGAKQAPTLRQNGSKRSSTPEVEEVTVALHLQSESELSSHHRTTQNDTDSSEGPVPPPRRLRAYRAGKSTNYLTGGNESSESLSTDADDSAVTATAANTKHYFGNEKSLPSSAHENKSANGQQSKRAPLNRFGEDSFYLPSSTQEGVDSLDDSEAPPLPSSRPPGAERAEFVDQVKQDRRDSLESSTSGMSIRDRIAMIERQLQSDKSGSKADSDQAFYWKKQSTENLRQAEVLEKDNKHLKEDLPPAYRRKEKINRLEKELEEKRRFINLLELWLSSLEDLLKNKNKQTDREMLEYLQLDLSKLRSELRQIGYRGEDAVLDSAALKTELEHRDKEIVSKRNEIETLAQQLKSCQQECQNIEDMRRTALDSLRCLEKEVLDLQDSETKLHGAQAELQALKVQYETKSQNLQAVVSEKNEIELTLKKTIIERDHLKCDLKTAEDDREILQPKVEELTQKVEDLSRLEAKNNSLEDQMNKLNGLLSSRMEKIQEVYTENLSLRDRVHQSELELIRLRNLCDDYNNLSARYDELEHQQQQAVSIIQPLQAKLERLARKCQEKDALLRRLGAELRRTAYRPSSALDDLTRLEKVMEHEEYNKDFPSVSNGTNTQRSTRNKSYTKSSSMDDLDQSYPSSDTDSTASLPIPSTRRKRHVPYVSNRPRSADHFSSGPRAHGAHAQPRSVPGIRPGKVVPQVWSGVSRGQFVAIADYDPAFFSQSGRQGLELELREGDCVLVTGPMDRTGYYEADVNGRTGLVPANYLQPIHGSSHMTEHDLNQRLSAGHLNRTEPLHHVQQGAFTRVNDAGINLKVGVSNKPHHAANQAQSVGSQAVSQMPDPPQNLHVKAIVDERSVLLSWLPPRLDNRGNNNGVKVLGYMVFLNNQAYEQIPSPKVCEVLVEGLNPDHHQHLAVQCLCAGGYISPRAEMVFEGLVKLAQPQNTNVMDQDQDDLDTDLSAVLNNIHYKRGQRKAVMALYDYNPKHQSPHDYTAFELSFRAGDVIHVYGDPRPDGFFHGEIDGKRGLVPACFVEDVSKIAKPSRRAVRDFEQQNSNA